MFATCVSPLKASSCIILTQPGQGKHKSEGPNYVNDTSDLDVFLAWLFMNEPISLAQSVESSSLHTLNLDRTH